MPLDKQVIFQHSKAMCILSPFRKNVWSKNRAAEDLVLLVDNSLHAILLLELIPALIQSSKDKRSYHTDLCTSILWQLNISSAKASHH